ncbi:MAG: hypothetical protein CVV22_11045 [Ignavibacteriae bacterium HGW-Ignavibacteriae-1]|jgi:polyhydroxybutyrate depolymerase|nr:MAG: hypothetical protein CVV22_11045 [Ignavibacteriae bacterium HGW-Ignavibacteriae-1]
MRIFIYIIVLVLTSYDIFAFTKVNGKMTIDGYEREFIVTKPDGTPPAGGYPVVFMFHGTSGDGEKFFNVSGWKEKGDKENFVCVFPSSLRWCFIDDGVEKNNTKWICGDLVDSLCPQEEIVDDIKFVRAMIDTLVNNYPIDRSRIYGTGFSNGGCFTSKMAVEASELFAALHAAGGGLHRLDSGDAVKNLPVWFSFGTKDDRFYNAVGLPELPFNDTTFALFGGLLRRYCHSLGLTYTSYEREETPITITLIFKTPGPVDVNNPTQTETTEFRATLMKDLAHEYPNGNNYPFAAADVLWEFFKQYTLTTDVQDNTLSDNIIISPIPADDFIEIRGIESADIKIYDLIGNMLLTGNHRISSKIDVGSLSSGVYLLEIKSGNESVFKRIIIK